MLERLEVYNFKSYKGQQTIGPFFDFTAVIGPNGAGKSNLMDAISFVLGVRSTTLRSSALKDLIYRSGTDRKQKGKAKAAADDEDESTSDEDEDEDEDQNGDGNGDRDGERKAWVRAIYVDQDDNEWTFQRSISTAGTSEYKINGKTVQYKRYNEQLEQFNILVKARNFLVFQGDVEQVASQSPKDLSRLIDQISGSLDYKEEYDRCAAALEKATEDSVVQHNKRKGINGEVKQYKEMKKEAERWKALSTDKENAIVHYLVWKLFHIEQRIDVNTEAIRDKNERLAQLRIEHGQFEDEQKAARKQVNKATKDAGKKDKEVKSKEKELEESRPALDAIDTQIEHAKRKLKAAESNIARVQRDVENGESKIQSLEHSLTDVQKASKKAQGLSRLGRSRAAVLTALPIKAEAARLNKSKGIELSDADLLEYYKLRKAANVKATAEREALASVRRECKSKATSLAVAKDSVGVSQRKLAKLDDEAAGLSDKKAKSDERIKIIQVQTKKANKELADLRSRKTQIAQTEQELNEKLHDTLLKLEQAGAAKQESARDAKFRETLATMKKTFAGVKGRLIDLCKPTHTRYSLAVTTVLGRNIDSIVVDNEATAIECVAYLRGAQAGIATFIPLETVQAKPPNDKFRSYARGARLAIDVITFDASVERAMQFACGNALICDSLEIAKHVCYDKGQEVKSVTLEGTVIHRSGLMTGGSSGNNSRHFAEKEVEALRRKETELRTRLGEIHKNKPKASEEEDLVQTVNRLNADMAAAKEEAASATLRLKNMQDEIQITRNTMSDLDTRVNSVQQEIDQLETKCKQLEAAIAVEEDVIFQAFCKRISVPNIRAYEDTRLRDAEAEQAAQIEFKKQIARLTTQLSFENETLTGTRSRLETLQATADREHQSIARLQGDRSTKMLELNAIEEQIVAFRAEHDELQAVVDERNAALDKQRALGSKTSKALDNALKEISHCNDEIERLNAERYTVYRRCKLEEIDLPLLQGSLERVPIDEAMPPAAPMDVDGNEDETQQALQAARYDIQVDFAELDEDEEQDGSSTKEEELQARITKLQAELEKMSPNLKAIEKLGDSEKRFREIDAEFEDARRTVKDARDAFLAVKKKRCELFNKAYQHISDNIDVVYKDLTKGKAAPMGGVAYLSLEDSEEPYLHGIKYHAMPPMKRFRDMDQLSGGERTMASLSLLFAIHSYQPSPFFVLDEVDAALDNTNVARVARYIQSIAKPEFQFIVISLKNAFFEQAASLVGIYRQDGGSRNLTLDLSNYA
ncbi:Structural maintenance of chromosomes protein 1 [Microbotryomycetes sp. JL201]|nr:Structural maintenance of chromosomes protein 1 [Microbotryomycetes sp. JL201]